MAQGPEHKVKQWLKRRILKQWPNAWMYWAPGGRFGRKGVPDLLLCVNGIFIAIEVKADSTKHPTAYQQEELELIMKAGGIACVMRGKNEVLLNTIIDLVNEYEKYLQKEIQIQE